MSPRAIVVVAVSVTAGGLAVLMFGPDVVSLLSVVLPVAVLARLCSFVLIQKGLASVWLWLLAGLLIPIFSLVGFVQVNALMSRALDRPDRWSELWLWVVFAGGIVAAPIGVIATLVIRSFLLRETGGVDAAKAQRK